MSRKLAACLLGSLVLLATGPIQSGEKPDGRAIVDKAIAAMGGEAKLEKHMAVTWKEKGTYYGMGEGLPYTANYAVQWPHQFRMEIEGIFTVVLNGDKGWIKEKGETKEMNKDQLAQQKRDHLAGWITTLIPLKDKAFKLSALGEVKVDKKPALGVQVSRKDFPDAKLFFDKKSGLLLKSEFRTKAPEEKFKDVTMTTFYSDYRDVDGVKMPHHLVMKRDGKLYVDATIVELKAAGKLDSKIFGQP